MPLERVFAGKLKLSVADDPLFDVHRAQLAHPERPARLAAARQGLAAVSDRFTVDPLAGRSASRSELARVHSFAYLDQLASLRGGVGHLDNDTYYCEQSIDAASRASGGAIGLVEALLGGSHSLGLGLLRPPGHHALTHQAMGFCILNHAAVAAAHARALGAERVAIVDWDVHHGNGTEQIFYHDPTVLYVSAHQFPYYPGTGSAVDLGSGDGVGYNVNIPLAPGAGDLAYVEVFSSIVGPILRAYDPDLVIISAGYDAHHADQLGGMAVTQEGFGRIAELVASSIPRGAAGRCALLLEGGYELGALRTSLEASLVAISDVIHEQSPTGRAAACGGDRCASEDPWPLAPVHEEDLARARQALRPFWRVG